MAKLKTSSIKTPTDAETHTSIPEDIPLSDILLEDGLAQVWWKSLRLTDGWFNITATLVALIASIVLVTFSQQTVSELATSARELCDLGLTFTSSILGFLVAGLAIFATFTQPDMLVEMTRIPEKHSKLSYFKYNYFTLIRTFIAYVVFAFLCFAGKILMTPHGAAAVWVRGLSDTQYNVRLYLCRAAFIIVVTGFCYLVLVLKSFIYNVYHTLATQVAWEREKNEDA